MGFRGRSVLNLVFVGVLILLGTITISTAQLSRTLKYRYVCPKDFENVGRKCYHFSKSTATWFQAYFSCRDLADSNFTVFTERYDQRQLENFLFRNRSRNLTQTPNLYWVGGFKDWKKKRWVYTDGMVMQFPTLKDIHLSEEDNWTCLLIDGNRKRWRAENCMERRSFICEANPVASLSLEVLDKKVKRKITIDQCVSKAEFLTEKQRKKCRKMLDGVDDKNQSFHNNPGSLIQQAKPAYPTQPTVITAISHICPQNWMALGNQCYLFSKEPATWSDAHFNCGQINAKLAIIRSKAQDQKLRIFLNGFTDKHERWLGGTFNSKTRDWIWALNAKPLKYRGFKKEPIPTNNLEWQAIVMDPQHAYRWSHRNQMEKHYYICQAKARAVKRLNYPKKPSATVEIVSNRRRRYQDHLSKRSSRRANRNKRM